MWKNYFKVTLRNFKNNKQYSLLNIFGLSVGLVAAFLSLLYVNHELSFDKHHGKSDNIFRIAHIRSFDGSHNELATTPLYLAKFLDEDVSGIKSTTRFLRDSYGLIEYQGKSYAEEQFAFADSTVFDVFDFEFVHGGKEDFERKESLAISEQIAKKYFGEENPIGKVLLRTVYGREHNYRVSCVYKKRPNSHFQFDLLAPFESPANGWNGMHGTDWFLSYAWTYVLLESAEAKADAEDYLANVVDNHVHESLKAGTKFYLQPLEDIHLKSNLQGEIEANGKYDYVMILLFVGLSTLLIACINYTNLATSQVLERAREVALRKTFGSRKQEVVLQFFIESSFYTFVSLFIALVFILVLLPGFNQLAGVEFGIADFLSSSFLNTLLVVFLIVSIISGSYPAIYLGSFKPIDSLRKSRVRGGGFLLRKILVVVQFTAVVMSLSGIFVINDQLLFLKEKDLGFDSSGIIYLDGFNRMRAQLVKEDAANIEGIEKISLASGIPGSLDARMLQTFISVGRNEANNRVEAFRCWADLEYFELLDIDLVTGRMPSVQSQENDVPSVVVNESMLALLPNPAQPLGEKIELYDFLGNSSGIVKVVGVVNDFNIESLQSNVKPMIFSLTRRAGNLIVKVEDGKEEEVSKALVTLAGKYPAETIPGIHSLKQDIDTQYLSEEALYRASKIFTAVAIIVALMGMYGLTSFSAQQRLNEMSIRKVLGADSKAILSAFSRVFFILIATSFISGSLISWFLSDQWLTDYAYRISIGFNPFIKAGAIVFCMVFIITLIQVSRLLKVNPAITLREN